MAFADLEATDLSYFKKSIEDGRAIIVLGAGASASSSNKAGSVPVGSGLSKLLADRAGLPYDGEALADVLSAVTPILGDEGCLALYKERYLGVNPAQDLQDLFSFTWKRLYTWNIDDSIDNISTFKAQSHSIFNGIEDKIAEPIGPHQLQVIYLHGQIVKPEKGLIMTEVDYAKHIKSDRHFWYQEAARDYLKYCPIFIGSALNEPILKAELERAKRQGISTPGKCFAITPDKLSPMIKAALNARGVVHIEGTLLDFVNWLKAQYPSGLTPKKIVANTNSFDANALQLLKPSDLEAAQALRPISLSNLSVAVRDLPFGTKSNLARQFLQGFPASWLIAASDIPVHLEALSSLTNSIRAAMSNGAELFVTLGQSGSGKSTATMMALLEIASKEKDIVLYDVAPDTKSLKRALAVLGRVETKKAIVHIGELFLYGGSIREDLEALHGKDVLLVGTARSSEWSEHLSRYLDDVSMTAEFQRFTKEDYTPLISRLIQYVPAPNFKRMSDAQRRNKLSSSKSQLLIALQEATEPSNFSDIISSEFINLPDNDTKKLLVLVGIATIARVGVSEAMAKQAFEQFSQQRSFENAMSALSGIVADSGGGRLLARHELYAHHVLDTLTSPEEFLSVASSLLHIFGNYETPVIKYSSRQDGILFKFLLNHDFIFNRVKRFKDREFGVFYYQNHEVDFQLDGHFWLQYGLFMGRIGRDAQAAEILTQSIRAYPDNPFAVHALADLQLKLVRNATHFDKMVSSLLEEAVTSLNSMDKRQESRTDHYPLVTLANGHIGCLLAHGFIDDALALSQEYYERLTILEKMQPTPAVKTARKRQLVFATTRDWDLPLKSRPPQHKGKNGSRRKITNK